QIDDYLKLNQLPLTNADYLSGILPSVPNNTDWRDLAFRQASPAGLTDAPADFSHASVNVCALFFSDLAPEVDTPVSHAYNSIYIPPF
ncbi:hypothetical protein TH53_23865, partial [Pedobacter lusitanus]